MPLGVLYCSGTKVSDLSPLENCKRLGDLNVRNTKVTPASSRRPAKSPAQLQDRMGRSGQGSRRSAEPAWNTPAFQQWVKATQALPAEKQIEAVSKKLMELNPGFDGKVTGLGWERHAQDRERRGHGVGFLTDNVTRISPVRALVGLKRLTCSAAAYGKGKLSDLSPLQGMKLTT